MFFDRNGDSKPFVVGWGHGRGRAGSGRELDQPNRTHAVGSHLDVIGQQSDAFDRRLGNQKSVERIFVMIRQVCHTCSVLAVDEQFEIAVVEERAPEQVRVNTKVGPAERILDGDLPNAGGAEIQGIRLVLDQCGHLRRQRSTRRIVSRYPAPKQQMSIEQELHSSQANIATISSLPNALNTLAAGTVT